MNTQHTPGPWQHGIENEGYFIAAGELMPDIAKRIRNRADADLIAAAPDLLEACKAYFAWVEVEHNHGETTFWERVEMCNNVGALMSAAIAKATGGAA